MHRHLLQIQKKVGSASDVGIFSIRGIAGHSTPLVLLLLLLLFFTIRGNVSVGHLSSVGAVGGRQTVV